ncbi:MAG TPA: hypothetical protein VEX43_17145 [Chthoniobacterales bacterium]|nr:hypothetical protein [Chthoniobacterales bacterium]
MVTISPGTRQASRLPGRLNEWLDSGIGQLCLLTVIALVYLVAYWNYDALPGASAQYPLGWWGWWDQGQYWKCAAGLAHGNLTAETFWYPIGYPVLGALFYSITPQHAFLIPDLLLALGIAALFYQIARRFITALETVLLMAVFVVCYHGLLADTLVVPWNTLPTHLFSYAVILLVGLGPPRKHLVLIAALCVGLMYLCRPGDAFCLALLVGVAVFRLPSWPERFWAGFASVTIVGAFAAFVVLLNKWVFGPGSTPYEMAVASSGFGGYPIWQKAFWLLVDNRPVFNEAGATLFSHFPWLPLTLPGIVYLLRHRLADIIGWLLSIGATCAIYFEFNDFWPSNLFRYLLIHYLVWTLPLLFLIAYLGLRDVARSRLVQLSLGLTAILVFALWLLTTQLKVTGQQAGAVPAIGQIPASPAEPVDWVLFEGVTSAPKLQSGSRSLKPRLDYVEPGRPKGVFLLLARNARQATLTYDASEAGALEKVQYGRLEWRFVSIRRALSPLLQKYSPRNARVVSEARVPGVDVAGPAGVPDGQPDQVIELDLAPATLRDIKVWDLQTGDGRAHWISKPNPQGWWLIKTVPGVTTLPKNRAGIRLCFPDFGQLDQSDSATLRGLDEEGRVILELNIRPADTNN